MFVARCLSLGAVSAGAMLFAWGCDTPLSAQHPDDVLHQIMMCESGGDAEAVNESESERREGERDGSYGAWQFGPDTWVIGAKAAFDLTLTDIDWSHGYPHAASMEVQRTVAKIIYDEGEGLRHWLNCARSLGLTCFWYHSPEHPLDTRCAPASPLS